MLNLDKGKENGYLISRLNSLIFMVIFWNNQKVIGKIEGGDFFFNL